MKLIMLIPVKRPRVPPMFAMCPVIVTLLLLLMAVTVFDANLMRTTAILFKVSLQNMRIISQSKNQKSQIDKALIMQRTFIRVRG